MSSAVAKSGFALVLLLCAATFALAQQAPSPIPQAGTILGTVVDVTGSTVPNATVVLQGPGSNNQRTVVTPDNGFFEFNGVSPATPVRVQVSASELKNWTSNEIRLQPGQFFILTDVTLAVAPVETSISAVTQEQVAAEQIKVEERQRVLSVIPNFYVTYEKKPAPLTAKLKFQLAMKALTDPVTITGFGLNAAIYQAAGYPSYQQGAAGYGQRLGATFAGGYSKILIGDAILPSLFHQDPRYFYQGTGSTKSRLLHALSTPFVARGDDGRRQINYSNMLGDLASGAIANAYYPSQHRGVGLVARSALIGAGGRMAMAIVQEFVLRKWTTHSSN